jgi:hypothetical protein
VPAAEARQVPRAARAISGRPNPPASWAGDSSRGSSSNASGFPRVSATIRSITRRSSGERTAAASSARASASRSPPTTRSGSPWKSGAGSRAANTISTDSACRRRAANASACAEARSSHCASSTTHRSGRSAATSDSRLSTARPTRNPIRRRARFQAERGAQGGPLRRRQPVQTIQHWPAQLVQRGEGQFHLRLDPDRPGHPQVRRLLDCVIQQGGLPHACLAPHDQHRAAPVAHLLEQPAQERALAPSPEQPAGPARRSFGTCQACPSCVPLACRDCNAKG